MPALVKGSQARQAHSEQMGAIHLEELAGLQRDPHTHTLWAWHSAAPLLACGFSSEKERKYLGLLF